MSYAELICQSNFSFLTGASHPEELVQQAEDLQYRAIAITDECSVAGVVRAYSHIKQEKLTIKLIVGSLFRFTSVGGFPVTLVLLCPNRKAYAELCRVITNSRRRCAKGAYQLSEWDLKSIQHCLVLWQPSGESTADNYWAKWLNKYYKNRSWLALKRQLNEGEHHYIAHCEKIAQQHQLSITAAGFVLMHNPQRLALQHTLTAISQTTTVDKLGKKAVSNAEVALRTLKKLSHLFSVKHIATSLLIAEQCHFDLGSLRYEYPKELIPTEQTPTRYLAQLVEQGKKRRFPQGVPNDINDIITKELSLIEEMAYEHFFITIYDVVQFAKQQGILYQGRGSAANSVVCYCLEITSVDPRQISVLFERFISKERQEPPDIDVDFEHQRREEVFQYIYQKYGRERTAIAATVITFRLKSAIREVGKALGFNETQLAYFIKNINRRDHTQDWRLQVTALGLEIESKQAQLFLMLVEEIKGFPRHLSQHVGGFIISSGPLYELVPIENAAMENRTVIQWDKDDLETLQLLKVDVLALGMLTAIRKSFDLIKYHYQHQLTIADITRLKDDHQVYDMIQQADTVGVFQIESRAQMSMLPRLKPETYYDLVIQIAIVRPGPIQGGMVHPYLKRRSGQEQVSYPSKAVESVLSRTLGVPIFQEQVIKIAMVAAGFTGGEADQLRRAMGKWKKTGELTLFKDKLISGMTARGYELIYAERIFNQICGFGEYGFPESHSASFAVLAYVSAWLKYYYPAVFYCSLLNSLPMGFYSASQLIQDAQRHNIQINPVCINESCWDHKLLEENQIFIIQLGFRLVKGLSEKGVTTLTKLRPNHGFHSLHDVQQIKLRKDDMAALASANCFRVLAGNRFSARWQIMDLENELPLFATTSVQEKAINLLEIKEKEQQYSLFPNDYDELIEDYASTGLSLDKHPISLLNSAGLIGSYTCAKDLLSFQHKSLVTVVGVVTGRQSPGTASGVTFMTLEDDTGNINVVVWVATARAQKQSFLSSKILKVIGIVEKENNVIHVIAGRLIDLTETLENLQCESRDFH